MDSCLDENDCRAGSHVLYSICWSQWAKRAPTLKKVFMLNPERTLILKSVDCALSRVTHQHAVINMGALRCYRCISNSFKLRMSWTDICCLNISRNAGLFWDRGFIPKHWVNSETTGPWHVLLQGICSKQECSLWDIKLSKHHFPSN